MKKHKKVRVVSIGAGENPIIPLNPVKEPVTAVTWATQMNDLLFNVEVMSHAFFAEQLSSDYHRYSIETNAALDSSTSIEEYYGLGK